MRRFAALAALLALAGLAASSTTQAPSRSSREVVAPLLGPVHVPTPDAPPSFLPTIFASPPVPVLRLSDIQPVSRSAIRPPLPSPTPVVAPTPAPTTTPVAVHAVRTPVVASSQTVRLGNADTTVSSVTLGSTVWDELAGCESGHHWADNTGNGFFGGLQFDYGTWIGAGGGKYAPRADKATREQQIAIAWAVQHARGWGPWPACSRKLGLYGIVPPPLA